MLTREDYVQLREVFLRNRIRLIIVAESPPASGKYFYSMRGKITEPLFSAIMRDVLGYRPRDKEDGLLAFRKAGYVLVDATYTPVDKGLTDRQRNSLILRDYSLLKQDLMKLTGGRDIPIVLIKANVCRLLEGRLLDDGINVINDGTVVPFPAFGNQSRFRIMVKLLLCRTF